MKQIDEFIKAGKLATQDSLTYDGGFYDENEYLDPYFNNELFLFFVQAANARQAIEDMRNCLAECRSQMHWTEENQDLLKRTMTVLGENYHRRKKHEHS